MVKSLVTYAIIAFIMFLPLSLPAQDTLACYPPCRPGFVCHNGNCISKCNPPCPDGQKCSDAGDCVAMSQSEAVASRPNDIKCVSVFVVRPRMDSTVISGTFAEREYRSASNLIADAITKKISASSAVITIEDIDAVKKCNARIIVVKVKNYYKEPAIMGQYHGMITISISTYDSPQQKTPAKTEEFSAKGNRHWGDSAPLENAIEAICREIRWNYKP